MKFSSSTRTSAYNKVAERGLTLKAVSIIACEPQVGYTRRSSMQSLSLQLSNIFLVCIQTDSRKDAAFAALVAFQPLLFLLPIDYLFAVLRYSLCNKT